MDKKDVEQEIKEMTSQEGDFAETPAARGRSKKKTETKIVRTNIDAPVGLLAELDKVSQSLNISRQALIKTWLLAALDHHYQSQLARLKLSEAK